MNAWSFLEYFEGVTGGGGREDLGRRKEVKGDGGVEGGVRYRVWRRVEGIEVGREEKLRRRIGENIVGN